MKAFMNLGKGFKATAGTTRMIFLLFFINLLFSMILAIPLYRSLSDSFGKSLVSERMARGFDYLWWEEFRDKSRGLETTFTPSIIGKGAILDNLENLIQMRIFELPPLVLVLAILYIILHTFLAGGILLTFNQKNPEFTMKRFLEGAGFYFSRFFLLTVISWLLFLAIGLFLAGELDSIVNSVAENSISEITPFYLGLVSSAIIFILFLLLQVVFDYSRIKIVLEERRRVLRSTLEAFIFVLKHPFSTAGLYSLIFLIQVGTTFIYVLMKEAIPQSNFLEVLAAFFLQELFIFAVIWLRCWLYSSQMELYRYLK